MKDVALVTGASSGIGLELSRLIAQSGQDLVLVARGADELTKVATELMATYKVKAYALGKDLSHPNAPQEIFTWLTEQNLQIDTLINNAGFATHGLFAESDAAYEMQMLEVNIKALTLLTRLALPKMIARKSGYIMNVASTAAFQPGPLMAGYYASKAYVLSFSEALSNELAGSGVSITTLCPGPTRTGFAKRAQIADGSLFKNEKLMSAAEVAQIGFKAMKAHKPVVITGHKNTLMAISTRLAPRGFAAKVARMIQEG